MKKRLLFLGPPGAGKGTQASILCKNQDLLHLSTGDLLRSEVIAGSALGKQAELIMNRGELVSDSIVLSIVQKELIKNSKGWLLDGFPRNLAQAQSLGKLLQEIEQTIECVLFLEIKDEILIRRLLSRGRDDDNEKVIRNRLEVYREQTAPLIEYYSRQEILKSVKGDADINVVASRIQEVLI